MENRIKDYNISGNSIILPRKTGIEDVRLIYNETQKVLICSTAKKDNLSGLGTFVYTSDGATLINVPTSVCVLQPTDKLTIKCDYGDEVATETTLNSAKEEILTAVDNAKPEIDTTELAKQGENPEATNTKILEEVQKINGLFASQLHDIIGE